MGSFVSTQRVNRQQRRRELIFLFYFIFGFIMIRIWIILIETNNLYVELAGGGITLILAIAIYLKYRQARQARDAEIVRYNANINNPDLASLHNLLYAQQRGLTQEMINTLHTFEYSKETHKREEDTNIEGRLCNLADLESANNNNNCGCSICLAEYNSGDMIIELPCNHLYHQLCISEWLLLHSLCPLCKADLRTMLPFQRQSHNYHSQRPLYEPSSNINNSISFQDSDNIGPENIISGSNSNNNNINVAVSAEP